MKIGERYGWKACGIVVCYNEDELIGPCLERLLPWVDRVVVFHSTQPWSPPRWPLDGTLGIIETYFPEVEVIVRYWPTETPQRNFTLEWAQRRGYAYAAVVDADEFYTTDAMQWLADRDWLAHDVKGVTVRQTHYWRDLDHRLEPRDTWTPSVLVRTDQRYRVIRDLECGLGGQERAPAEPVTMHHLSFVRSLPRVILKMLNSSHAEIVVKSWWDRWRNASLDEDATGSCWPYPAATMRAVRDPCPDEIRQTVAAWEAKARPFQTLDLEAVCAQVGMPVR